MVTALAALIYAWMGRPAEAARWADAVDRWDQDNPVRPDRGAIGAWAALVQAFTCRHGIAQMRGPRRHRRQAVLRSARRRAHRRQHQRSAGDVERGL